MYIENSMDVIREFKTFYYDFDLTKDFEGLN